MAYRRLLLTLVLVIPATLALAQEPPLSLGAINLPAGANLAEIPNLAALFSPNADRLAGPGPWTPPAGDPAKITKADYAELLKPYLPYLEPNYGKDPKERPGPGRYWAVYAYAFVFAALEALNGTPGYEEGTRRLGTVLAECAQAWPGYWEMGAQNRSQVPAMWYEYALEYDPPVPRAPELKTYADEVWSDWWTYRDVEEDCPGYAGVDVMVLNAWSTLRGVKPWEDPDARRLWLNYARQIANDGNYPAYAKGGNLGNYFQGLCLAEIGATRCRDGSAKWLAHRAFFSGRERIEQMCSGLGGMNYVWLALAYLYADDTIAEVPPVSGVTIAQRAYHLINDLNKVNQLRAYCALENRPAPSKVIFRGGSRETDHYMLVQAAGQSGHGHPDAGAILQYSGDWAFYLCHGFTRLDHRMEHHNLLTLRDPQTDKPREGSMTAEDYGVPVSGQSPEGAHARVHLQEAPGVNVAEAWEKTQAWAKKELAGAGYPPNLACGYKNWPVRLDRSVVFVNNQFAVVRDVMTPTLPVAAQIGQNWVVGNFGPTVGPN